VVGNGGHGDHDAVGEGEYGEVKHAEVDVVIVEKCVLVDYRFASVGELSYL